MSDNRTFVSYSRADSEFALKLASDLRANGASVWLDQLDIAPGARWDSSIEDALRRSARVIVLLSPKAVASQNVLDEVSFALDEGKTIVPVLVETCAVPMRLRRLQYVDFTPGYEAALGRLLVTLGVARSSVSRPAAPPPPPEPEPERSPQEPLRDVTMPATSAFSGQRTMLIAGVAAAIVAFVGVAIWMSSRPDGAPDAPTDTVVDTTASTTPAETPAPDNTAAAPPAPAEGTASRAVRMAEAGQPGGVGSMLAPLRRTTTPDDSDLPALLALARELSDRASLSAADLERLGDAEFKACPFSVDPTPCSKQADASVASLLESVCKRQTSPDVSSCKSDYEFAILRRQSEKASEMLKRIKPG